MDTFFLILAGNERHTLCLFHDDDLPLVCMGDKVFNKILLYGVSSASIAKLSKGANITTDVLLKICEAMSCHIEDILETIDD